MGREDYAHWNEEADLVWWLEEGRHAASSYDYDRDHDRECDVPEDDWEDFDDDEDEDAAVRASAAENPNWQAEDAGWENALFGDC